MRENNVFMGCGAHCRITWWYTYQDTTTHEVVFVISEHNYFLSRTNSNRNSRLPLVFGSPEIVRWPAAVEGGLVWFAPTGERAWQASASPSFGASLSRIFWLHSRMVSCVFCQLNKEKDPAGVCVFFLSVLCVFYVCLVCEATGRVTTLRNGQSLKEWCGVANL